MQKGWRRIAGCWESSCGGWDRNIPTRSVRGNIWRPGFSPRGITPRPRSSSRPLLAAQEHVHGCDAAETLRTRQRLTFSSGRLVRPNRSTVGAGEKDALPPNRTWEQIVLKDFDDLQKAGLVDSEFARIRELLAVALK